MNVLPDRHLDSLSLFWNRLASVAAALALVQAVLLLIQTVEHRRYLRQPAGEPAALRPTGPAVVFVPCKGLDLGLADNLRPLFEQDYADYRLVFVVESLRGFGLRARSARCWPNIRASPPAWWSPAGPRSCGQKVHNLLRATEQLADDVRFLAFADSDVRPSPTWLRR